MRLSGPRENGRDAGQQARGRLRPEAPLEEVSPPLAATSVANPTDCAPTPGRRPATHPPIAGLAHQQRLTNLAFPTTKTFVVVGREVCQCESMAAPVARVRRIKRPATVERQTTLGNRDVRAHTLAETSPYRRRTSGSIVIDEAELAATNLLDNDNAAQRPTTDQAEATEFGPFVVFEKLGEGGMATVHRAEYVAAAGMRKEVALKRLHTDASEDPALVDAFVHEAQLSAKLQHPNIAQAYELGKIEDTYFIAMELVPGPTLLQVMNQTTNGAGAVPLPIALELLVQIADALDHVH